MKRILHQADVQTVIDAAITEDRNKQNANLGLLYAARGTAVIAAPTAPGAAYVQAEAASMKTAVDAIRLALTTAGITA